MNKSKVLILFGIIVLLLAILLFGYKAISKKIENSSNSISKTPLPYIINIENDKQEPREITKDSSKNGWVTYMNNIYGYEIDVPSGSLLIQEDVNAPNNYTRIQNYPANSATPELVKGEYYLEISTNNAKSIDAYSCKEGLFNPIEITLNGIKAYKGTLPPGGDSAPITYALCFEKDSINFNISVSEGFNNLSREIINSFRFIK
jgi:hypothetical protein